MADMNQERRQAAAAKRKAAKGQKEQKEPRDFQFQPDSEPPIQDAHQATPDGGVKIGLNAEASGDPAEDSSSDLSVEYVGVSGPDAPAQASVGGAVKNVQEEIVISDDDLESEEKRPAHKDPPDEAPTIKREGPLSTVKEEVTPPAASAPARPKTELSPTDVALPPSRESSLGTPPSPAPQTDVDLSSEKSEEGRPEWTSVDQAKAYVAEQVRRWERVVVEYVVSPTVRYEWPAASPDFQAWWRAMTLTTEYVLSRTAMAAQSEAWISEWALERMGPNTTEDIATIVVPPSTLSPRECMALLQTLFFEAGFRFRNLIPEWFRTRASRVDPNLIRRVTEDLQHLLGAEFLEWRSITAGVASRIVSAEEAQTLETQNTLEDVKAEDQDGDLLMSTYEADLVGKDFVARLKNLYSPSVGLRIVRDRLRLQTLKVRLNFGWIRESGMAGGPITTQKREGVKLPRFMVQSTTSGCRSFWTPVRLSMISFDLARRLKLKINSGKQIKVSGLGGVSTYISASTEVKLTLGHRVVYVSEFWVANIGEDVHVLLGMDFMLRAGVRLCIREGLMVLPDEETVLMYGDVIRKHQGIDLPVCPLESLYLRPGESTTVQIRYGQANPWRDVVWAGRGDRWVTQIIYGAKSWATGVKVVNISNRDLLMDFRMPIARIVEKDRFPSPGHFVRPGSRRYQEWQQLVYENTVSQQAKLRARRFEQMMWDAQPPAVQTHEYKWPTKLLLKPATPTG
uniref:Peptidase A2 domain-containing protein n=1 Tax=Phytophthora ramorum TaxID=164328 RepID=H3H209_PHYRM